jgi:hypothetical protein
MHISASQINQLKTILLEITGKEYSTQELQTEGLKILRFVYALEIRKHLTNSELHKPFHGNPKVMPRKGLTSPNYQLNNKESKHEN